MLSESHISENAREVEVIDGSRAGVELAKSHGDEEAYTYNGNINKYGG